MKAFGVPSPTSVNVNAPSYAAFVYEIPNIGELIRQFHPYTPLVLLDRIFEFLLMYRTENDVNAVVDFLLEDEVNGLLTRMCTCDEPECPKCNEFNCILDNVIFFTSQVVNQIRFQSRQWQELNRFFKDTHPCYLSVKPLAPNAIRLIRPDYRTIQTSSVHSNF